jgi:dTDP-4-dehydrorhamnose 3,5-epimerase
VDQVITLSTGVQVTPLRRISHPDGDICHALKAIESSFSGFGEAYFTSIHKNRIKGWKRHQRMVLNLIVPVGNVTFYVHDEQTGRTAFITLGEANYARLTVPFGLWVAFSGIGPGLNLILNIASIPHDPNESENFPILKFPTRGYLCENITDRL